MLHAAQGVLEGAQGAGCVAVSLLSGQVELQLFQNFNHLLLGLGFGRLFTAVRGKVASQERCIGPGERVGSVALERCERVGERPDDATGAAALNETDQRVR